MLWGPAASVLVVYAALVPETGMLPRTVVPSLKSTLPVSVPVPVTCVSVAVNVTL